MKDFALKFIDIIIGIILGMGFGGWPNLHEPWQFIAFFFAYLNLIDYWIDYTPTLRKYPPKSEINLISDVAVLFMLFLFIYSTQRSIIYFLVVFIIFRLVDMVWILQTSFSHDVTEKHKSFFDTWLRFDILEIIVAVGIGSLVFSVHISALSAMLIFIFIRVVFRIIASLQYKSIHFA